MTLLTSVPAERGRRKISLIIVIRAEDWCINSVLVSVVTNFYEHIQTKKGYKNDYRNNTTRLCEHRVPFSSSPPEVVIRAN
jgi:hypothetical protein